MNEIWKEIKGYEGLYEISNLGRVKSLARIVTTSKGIRVRKQRFLKNCGDINSYLHVCLTKDSKTRTKRIHQLVAIAFLNHTPNGFNLVVDHINSVKTDNRLENLQIITSRENTSKDKKGGSSKYTGVHWFNRTKKWKVQIKIDGKSKHLGYFTDELKASEAYQKALKELIK